MNLSLLRFAIIVAFLGTSPVVSAARGILPWNHPTDWFASHGKCAPPVRMTGKARLGPKLALACQQTPAVAPQPPLSKDQLLELITGGVPIQRAVELVRERGVDFKLDDEYMRLLRKAGGNELLIAALRKASAATAEVLVETAPNAQVFLDGDLQGAADAQGVLEFQSKLGAHTIKVSLAGRRDFEQGVTVEEGQSTRVVATLADLIGSLQVKAPPGATVWLDDSSRGTIDSTGMILLSQLSPGAHILRVTAQRNVRGLQCFGVAPRAV